MASSESMSLFSIRGEHRAGTIRLRARGELDVSTAPLLDQALLAVEARDGATIVLDFEELNFMDSTGLHILLRSHGRAMESGRVLVVINGNQGVRKVFEITGSRHLLQVTDEFDPLASFASDEESRWEPIPLPGIDRPEP